MKRKTINVTIRTVEQLDSVTARLQPGDRIQVLCEDGFLEAEKLSDGSFDILRQVPTHSQTQ